MVLNLLATQHGMAHAAQFGKHADRKNRVRVNCPFCLERKHSPDRGHSFIYYRNSGFYKCFRCGIRSLDDLNVEWDATHPEPIERQAFKWTGGPKEFIPLWDAHEYPEPMNTAVEYLERRGIDREIRLQAHVGCCIQGRYAGRVVVPHLNSDGSWWGWSARLWKNIPGARNYDYPPDMARDKLYNEVALSIDTNRPVMVVEGVMDSLLYIPHAVACLGQPTHEHFDILKRSKRPIALCFDADRWYVGKTWQARLTKAGVKSGWVLLPHGLDPNEMDAAVLRDAADKCIGGKIEC